MCPISTRLLLVQHAQSLFENSVKKPFGCLIQNQKERRNNQMQGCLRLNVAVLLICVSYMSGVFAVVGYLNQLTWRTALFGRILAP